MAHPCRIPAQGERRQAADAPAPLDGAALPTGDDLGALADPALRDRCSSRSIPTIWHKLAKNLGLTRRNDVSWKTAEEITAALRRFDPADPVKYDFSLCHLGMLQRCPSRRDPVRCEDCGVMPVCLGP